MGGFIQEDTESTGFKASSNAVSVQAQHCLFAMVTQSAAGFLNYPEVLAMDVATVSAHF